MWFIGKRTWKNIRGQVDGEIEQYRTMLLRLRDDFLARAAVTTEVAVLDVSVQLGQVGVTRLNEMNSQLMAMSTIEKLPYKGGWRLGDKNRCLPGTRKDFLDYIVKWINNPESKRGLVLLGQAGTGKSSIAHEVARRFENKHLGSYFAFLRKEQSKDEAYQLFTTLARDLSDRNPAFKVALGRVVKDNSSLCGTRDYRTLFESLLLEPLKSVQVRDPILVVIDALDESGDAIGENGLHHFLAQHLSELPSYLRILITSRPEDGVEAAFSNVPSVDTLYMDDARLAAKTEEDICLYIQSKLPPDIFKEYGIELAKSAEGLFQWVAVACGFINSPPASFGFSKKKCMQCLLGHSQGRHGQDPLDMLYEEVLEGYFKPDEAQILFRSVMGQLFAAIEPLSLQSLITLRRHAPIDDPDDSDAVLEMLRRLGSLLSNVTSSDQARPIIPLHTSFRDFLINKKSAMFYVDLGDSHHQLTHSCLELMLDNLKFNICKLESSYIANSDVPDLESRITNYIPPALLYACVSWDNHIKCVAFEHDLFTKVRSLFSTKFLFWLEVLSMKRSVGLASRGLSSLKIWLRSDQRTVRTLYN
jgi:NACHT domain